MVIYEHDIEAWLAHVVPKTAPYSLYVGRTKHCKHLQQKYWFKGCAVVFCCTLLRLLCCAVLCCAVLCCAVLCCAVLCCAVLCCAVLCCAVLCCAVLCCAV
jgi:hypothetical protein